MSKIVVVQITQADIERGYRGAPRGCPVGIALTRAGHPHTTVSRERLYFHLDGVSGGVPVVVKTPEEAAKFILAFDNGLPVAPLDFLVEVPDAPALVAAPEAAS